MLICRVHLPGQGPRFGRVVEGESGEVELLAGDPVRGFQVPTGERLQIDWEQVLCPLLPGKIVGVGSNYHDHTVEMGKPLPREPVLFMKPPSALLDPGRPIRRPPGYGRVDYEGELAVVVGRRMSRVAEADVMAHLFGFTALNDVTVRDLQKQDGQFTRAKGMDSFCPLGPAICTDLSFIEDGRFQLRTYLNGQKVQDSRSDRFLFSVDRLLSFISHFITLEPGDVVTTGTPAGVGNLEPGDVVEISIDGLPPLRNPVVAGEEPYRL